MRNSSSQASPVMALQRFHSMLRHIILRLGDSDMEQEPVQALDYRAARKLPSHLAPDYLALCKRARPQPKSPCTHFAPIIHAATSIFPGWNLHSFTHTGYAWFLWGLLVVPSFYTNKDESYRQVTPYLLSSMIRDVHETKHHSALKLIFLLSFSSDEDKQ